MFEAGKTYKTRDGRAFRVYATDGVEPYSVHGAIRCDAEDYWVSATRTESGRKYEGKDSDDDLVPDPPPLPPIDITKPRKTKAGNRVINLGRVGNRLIGDVERTGIKPLRGVEWEFDGRCWNADHEHDLIQCAVRPWTRADVPWPRPEFRQRGSDKFIWLQSIGVGHDGLHLAGFGLVDWATLQANWQYSVDGGKTWLACEVVE